MRPSFPPRHLAAALACAVLSFNAPRTMLAQGAARAAAPLTVSTAWLAEHLKDPNLVLLHVGDRKGYDKEHIPGARFIDLDDISVCDEGEEIHAKSILSLPIANKRCVLPQFDRVPDDPFLRQVDESGMRWVIVTEPSSGEPVFVLDAHHFLRDALFDELAHDPNAYWHRPIVVRDMRARLGDVIGRMKVVQERPDDDVIENDMILVWGPQRRIITGSDLLGRLLRGIAIVESSRSAKAQ